MASLQVTLECRAFLQFTRLSCLLEHWDKHPSESKEVLWEEGYIYSNEHYSEVDLSERFVVHLTYDLRCSVVESGE